MAKAPRGWKILPHSPVRTLAENAWHVEGSVEGMPLGRSMTVARRRDGSLVVHNAICLEEAAMKELEAHGPVGTVVVPNGWHRLDVAAFKDRYPQARVLCPAGARKKVSSVVAVDGTYDDLPDDGAVRLVHLDGLGRQEGFLEVRSPDGVTLAFNDIIFNLARLPGFSGWIFHNIIGSTGGPKVTRVGKLFMVKDKAALRRQLETLAALPDLKRVIVMHGRSPESDAAGFLRTVVATL